MTPTHWGRTLFNNAVASSSVVTLGAFFTFAYAGPSSTRIAVLPVDQRPASPIEPPARE